MPDLAALSPTAVIVAFLGQLAFSDDAVAYHDIAMQILDEWWLPQARYRDRRDTAT